jgi:hypothetical protein
MEVQVLDDGHEKYKGWLKDWQRHGSVYGIAASDGSTAALRPAGEWNDEEIVVDGRRIKVTLNGRAILDVDLDVLPVVVAHDGSDDVDLDVVGRPGRALVDHVEGAPQHDGRAGAGMVRLVFALAHGRGLRAEGAGSAALSAGDAYSYRPGRNVQQVEGAPGTYTTE